MVYRGFRLTPFTRHRTALALTLYASGEHTVQLIRSRQVESVPNLIQCRLRYPASLHRPNQARIYDRTSGVSAVFPAVRTHYPNYCVLRSLVLPRCESSTCSLSLNKYYRYEYFFVKRNGDKFMRESHMFLIGNDLKIRKPAEWRALRWRGYCFLVANNSLNNLSKVETFAFKLVSCFAFSLSGSRSYNSISSACSGFKICQPGVATPST